MFTQRPSGGWNEEHQVCSLDGVSIDGLIRPSVLSDPMGDGELEALVLAQCFSLARSRARELRRYKPPIVAYAECEAGETVGLAASEPERRECATP